MLLPSRGLELIVILIGDFGLVRRRVSSITESVNDNVNANGKVRTLIR